jgi:hypothetical protein
VGGAETLVATLTLALVRSGCATPVIITANQPTAEITDVVRDGGGDLVVLPNQPRPGRLPWIHDMFHKSEALHDVLQRQALDIMHAFYYDTAITAAITLPQHRPDRVPLVGTFSEITLPERDATEHLRASFAFPRTLWTSMPHSARLTPTWPSLTAFPPRSCTSTGPGSMSTGSARAAGDAAEHT